MGIYGKSFIIHILISLKKYMFTNCEYPEIEIFNEINIDEQNNKSLTILKKMDDQIFLISS